MSAIPTLGCIVKNFLAIGGSALAVDKLWPDRPPIASGIMVRTYFFARNKIISCFYLDIDNPKRDVIENFVDIIVPYTYYKIADNSLLLDRLNLDFCLPGTFGMCFIAQRVNKIYEQIFTEKNDKIETEERASFYLDGMYVLIAALSVFMSAVRFSKKFPWTPKRMLPCRIIMPYAVSGAIIALVERACIRCIDWFEFNEKNERIKKIVSNVIQLFSSRIIHLKVCIIHQLFWSIVIAYQSRANLSK